MHHNGNKQIFIRRNVTVRHGDNEDRRQNQLPAIFESFKEGYLNKKCSGGVGAGCAQTSENCSI